MPFCTKCQTANAFHELINGTRHKCTAEALKNLQDGTLHLVEELLQEVERHEDSPHCEIGVHVSIQDCRFRLHKLLEGK